MDENRQAYHGQKKKDGHGNQQSAEHAPDKRGLSPGVARAGFLSHAVHYGWPTRNLSNPGIQAEDTLRFFLRDGVQLAGAGPRDCGRYCGKLLLTMKLPRRKFLTSTASVSAGLAAGGTWGILGPGGEKISAAEGGTATRPFLTAAGDFEDVSRGNPKPFTLKGQALVEAGLTPETWRLEIRADEKKQPHVSATAEIERPVTLDLKGLMELGKEHGVKFIKAMQCLNIPTPLGQGLWEGVPLSEVLRLCGTMKNVRRVYFWGFHNDNPAQMFRSSLSYSQVMETPPGELPVFVAYRLNGEPLTLERGGPVRMVVPWAHGFKSIKWLQHVVLTNDYHANDTYAEKNNDPESRLKTAAYLDDLSRQLPAGRPVYVSGQAISGWSGLKRVEYWVRQVTKDVVPLDDDDPAWQSAQWIEAALADPPMDWKGILPAGVSSREVLGFDSRTGKPRIWPLRYSMVSWGATLKGLNPGHYELRARAVDLNGYAQPEPRPIQKAGKNAVEVTRFEVV